MPLDQVPPVVLAWFGLSQTLPTKPAAPAVDKHPCSAALSTSRKDHPVMGFPPAPPVTFSRLALALDTMARLADGRRSQAMNRAAMATLEEAATFAGYDQHLADQCDRSRYATVSGLRAADDFTPELADAIEAAELRRFLTFLQGRGLVLEIIDTATGASRWVLTRSGRSHFGPLAPAGTA